MFHNLYISSPFTMNVHVQEKGGRGKNGVYVYISKYIKDTNLAIFFNKKLLKPHTVKFHRPPIKILIKIKRLQCCFFEGMYSLLGARIFLITNKGFPLTVY